jgi:uncharacterized protein (TIGR03067 family)
MKWMSVPIAFVAFWFLPQNHGISNCNPKVISKRPQQVDRPGTGEEIAKLRGVWKVISMDAGQGLVEDDVVKSMRLVFRGNSLAVFADGDVYRGTFDLDITKKPREMIWNLTDSGRAGAMAKKSVAFFHLKGGFAWNN